MSHSEGLEVERKATPENDMETATARAEGPGFGAGNVLRRWRRDDFIRKGSLSLRAFGLVFSALSFIIMSSNNHGGQQFGNFEEYRYLLAIAILSTLYTGLQCFRHIHQLSTGKEFVDPKTSALIDFVGDQIIAYLLLSSASSAIPITNRMREGGDNIFTDSAAAAISMSLLAFISLATSSVIAGYKLSTQSSI